MNTSLHHAPNENKIKSSLPHPHVLSNELPYVPVVHLPRTTVFLGKRRSIVTHESQCSLLNTNRSSDGSGKPETIDCSSAGELGSVASEKPTEKEPDVISADPYVQFITLTRKKWWRRPFFMRAKPELKNAVPAQNYSS